MRATRQSGYSRCRAVKGVMFPVQAERVSGVEGTIIGPGIVMKSRSATDVGRQITSLGIVGFKGTWSMEETRTVEEMDEAGLL